jgi:hypothetical protein
LFFEFCPDISTVICKVGRGGRERRQERREGREKKRECFVVLVQFRLALDLVHLKFSTFPLWCMLSNCNCSVSSFTRVFVCSVSSAVNPI